MKSPVDGGVFGSGGTAWSGSPTGSAMCVTLAGMGSEPSAVASAVARKSTSSFRPSAAISALPVSVAGVSRAERKIAPQRMRRPFAAG